jgi:phosphate transport system substrate-binding protein
LNADIISGIFLGTISQWNDPKIQAVNPSILLPDLFIVPIHRTNSSGTTYIFSEYLSKTSPTWKEQIGTTPTLENAVGIGADNSLESAKMLQQIPGGIAYQELSYCISNHQAVAKIQNQKGNFIKPSIQSVSQSGNTAIPADGRISLTNTDSLDGYPISSFSWIVLYKEQHYNKQTKKQAEELVKLVWWMTHDGQKLIEEAGYSPLHKRTILAVEDSLKSITYDGKAIHTP